jgi:GT2 family glycosyltransferase
VIIINHDGYSWLRPCLESVRRQQVRGGCEVLVVDNGSTDGSQDLIRREFPDCTLLEAGRNLGFAGGNNLGLRAGIGEYLVLLNNDTAVRPGWLQALIDAAESDPEVGAVTAKLLYAGRPGTIQSAGTELHEDGGGGDRGSGEIDDGQYNRLEEVFGLNGASALLCRRALEDVGLLDEAFFMYYEDTDLSWRLRLRGWKILYQPAAEVYHVHAASSREWSPFFTFHADRNRLLMLLKNARWRVVLRAGFALLGQVFRRSGAPGAGDGEPGRRGRRGVGHYLRVFVSLLVHLPRTLVKRRRVRGRRRLADAQIERWMQPKER